VPNILLANNVIKIIFVFVDKRLEKIIVVVLVYGIIIIMSLL